MKKHYFSMLCLAFLLAGTCLAQSNALQFDGSNDRVLIPFSSSLNMANNLTIEAWVFPTGSQDRTTWVSKVNSNGNGSQYRGTHRWSGVGPYWGFSYRDNSNNWHDYFSDVTLPAGTWTHVAITVSTSEVKLYRNGAFEKEWTGLSIALPTSTNPAYIGYQQDDNFYFSGKIDEVRIWDVVRSASDILANYDKELCIPPSGLVAYYQFTQLEDLIGNNGLNDVRDYSGFDNHGEVQGGAGIVATGPVLAPPTNLPETCNGIDDDCDGSTDEGCCPSGNIYYVNASVSGGNQSGDSWANAFSHLQQALDQLDDCPLVNEIWVAEGTYKPTVAPGPDPNFDYCNLPRCKTFKIDKNLSIYGGFAGTESTIGDRNIAAHPTILSGDIGAIGDASDNSVHVVWIVTNYQAVTLDGLTVRDGDGTGSPVDPKGSGIYARKTALTVVNCNVLENRNISSSGGLFLDNPGNTSGIMVNIQNTVFQGNHGIQGGGAGFFMETPNSTLTVQNCGFFDNEGGGAFFQGSSGTGITALVQDCDFQGNYLSGFGIPESGAFFTFPNNTITLTGCSFEDNTGYNGGGLGVATAQNLTVTGCQFVNNHSSQGGGIYVDYAQNGVVTNCDFLQNTADNEGGGAKVIMPAPNGTFQNCSFENNEAQRGGGLWAVVGSINSCEFLGNHATLNGGGFYSSGYTSQIKNSIFKGNSAGLDGGGINGNGCFDAFNCLIIGNSAGERGGGIFMQNCIFNLTNCTVAANKATSSGGGAWVGPSATTIKNSIFWGNSHVIQTDPGFPPTLSNTISEGGCPPGSGCTSVSSLDPLFISLPNFGDAPTLAGDFHLQSGSPGIETGINAANTTPFDLDGEPRIQGQIDMGAYEETGCAPTLWYADSDGDGAGDPAVSQLSCTQPSGFVANSTDGCPNDANKIAPGICGCGTADTDTDSDGTADCNDGCPLDPNKVAPGICGCGTADTDTDSDGTADCNDGCPNDPLKIAPGICGCGTADTDTDGDGTADCNDGCPNDANKIAPGICGCGIADTDTDSDGTADCNDGCPLDPLKIAAGICGCGVADTDTDGDLTADCNDGCPNDANKIAPGICGCGIADTDTDGDLTADCNDGCPNDPLKIAPGICGCGVADTDTDGDLTADCNDGCPADPLKIAPGTCGCGTVDDADYDGYLVCQNDCNDNNSGINPAATEACGNNLDDDCDGVIDEGCNPCSGGGNGTDLLVLSAEAPAIAQSGEQIVVEGEVKNIGTVKAPHNSKVRWYLSNDAVWDASDYTESNWKKTIHKLDPGEAADFEKDFHLPSSGWCGAKYLIFRADDENNVAETFECNNTLALPIFICCTNADLRVQNQQAPNNANAGAVITMSAKVKNHGSGAAPVNKLKFCLSGDNVFGNADDAYLGFANVPALNGGQLSAILSASVTIPAGALGTCTLFYFADADLEVCETNENNNVKSRSITIGSSAGGGNNGERAISFSAVPNRRTTVMYWLAKFEQDVVEMTVERSADGIDFQAIAAKTDPLEAGNPATFQHRDESPLDGENFYRIRFLLADATIAFTEIRSVRFESMGGFEVFPNPAQQAFSVLMERFGGKEVEVLIADGLGRVVYRRHYEEVTDKLLEINRPDTWMDGIYQVSVVHRGKAFTKRLVIVRED